MICHHNTICTPATRILSFRCSLQLQHIIQIGVDAFLIIHPIGVHAESQKEGDRLIRRCRDSSIRKRKEKKERQIDSNSETGRLLRPKKLPATLIKKISDHFHYVTGLTTSIQ